MGRGNVGKSTLIDRIFGEKAGDLLDGTGRRAGTVFIFWLLSRRGQRYTLIDAAGRAAAREDRRRHRNFGYTMCGPGKSPLSCDYGF